MTTQYENDLIKFQQNGYALKYVKEQTPEICLAAVQQHSWALQYVKEQTPDKVNLFTNFHLIKILAIIHNN